MMDRSKFLLGGIVAGLCAACSTRSGRVIPPDQRSLQYINQNTCPSCQLPPPTPVGSIDPVSGLIVIGRTTSKQVANIASVAYASFIADYTLEGGGYSFNTVHVPWSQYYNFAIKCAGEMAAAASALLSFTVAAAKNFTPQLLSKLGPAAYTRLFGGLLGGGTALGTGIAYTISLAEAAAAALGILSLSDIALAAAAVLGGVAVIIALIRCVGSV